MAQVGEDPVADHVQEEVEEVGVIRLMLQRVALLLIPEEKEGMEEVVVVPAAAAAGEMELFLLLPFLLLALVES